MSGLSDSRLGVGALVTMVHRVMRQPLLRRGRGFWVATGLSLFAALGCKEKPEPAPTKAPQASPAEAERIHAALETYAELAYSLYADSSEQARHLLQVADDFIAAPSEAGLTRAREAWLAARVPYRQTEVFRFYDGPIDQVELEVNTWPIDEGFVEGQAGSTALGIVDDVARYPKLSLELLSELNGKDGETSISTGYHVVEYLLWGVDRRADGPGDRPFSDYVGDAGSVPARRGQYLHLAIENLARNLETVRDAWAPGQSANYRARFLAQRPESALALVIKGMGALSGGELAGERMIVAYETKSQENEHSCFSDTTTSDLVGNALGLLNVCKGESLREGKAVVRGTGICDAVGARSPELGARLRSELERSWSLLGAIPAPFDQAIQGDDASPGRASVWSAIQAVEQQARTLSEIASRLDLRIVQAADARQP